jgi:hypothetical protein
MAHTDDPVRIPDKDMANRARPAGLDIDEFERLQQLHATAPRVDGALAAKARGVWWGLADW